MTCRDRAFPHPDEVASRRILVVGDTMLDRYWHGEVERISPEAPVPVVHIKREEDRLGGAANVAFNVRKLGAQSALLSTVGTDPAAESLRALLKKHEIGSQLLDDPRMETIVKLRVMSRSYQMLRIDFEKVPDHEVLASMLDRYESVLQQHDLVVFSDYAKGGLIHIARMIGLARELGKRVLVDPKGGDWRKYQNACIVTPNRAELTQVIGQWHNEADLQNKVYSLIETLNLGAVLLTRSEEGMTLFQQGVATTLPAEAREVADVTGAGDTVIGTMAVLSACGFTPKQAMSWANRAGGLVVAKAGAASLTYEELKG